MRKWLTILVALGLLAAMVLPALAVAPVTPNDRFDIKLPEFDTYSDRGFAGVTASRVAEQNLARRYGGAWEVYAWNGQTGTPRWVYGDPVRVGAAVRDVTDLELLGRQVIDANVDVLGADGTNLKLASSPRIPGKWAAHFQQTYHGLDVWQARVSTVFTEDGRLMLMGSNYFRDIELDPTPALSAEAAGDIARGDLPFNPATDRMVGEAQLMVLPVALAANEVEHHLVWRVSVRTNDPLGEWVTHVDAHDGEIVWRYNHIVMEYSGDTTMPVHVNSYCDGSQDLAVPYLNLNVAGVGAVTTDAAGDWSIAGTGGNRAVTAAMTGTYVRVFNYNGAEAAYTGTAQENVPLTVAWTSLNSRADERDTFDSITKVHDFMELVDPGFSYTNQQIDAYVNRNDGYCPGNAWWDGTINFCAASTQYGNTGEMQQVVEHEFGHGVQDELLGGWQGDQGLGEGNSDILGNLITQDPIIGRGFYVGNCVSGIRNSLNSLSYPNDVIGIPIHTAGQVIAGFNWDAMVLLQAQYGDQPGTIEAAANWHFGRMLLQPSTQPDQVLATFVADDDNGDLTDGTPHHAIYSEAATNHGFESPEILVGVFVYHTALPYQTRTSGTYEVRCTVASLGGGNVDPNSVAIHYNVDGGAMLDLPMLPQAGEFVVALPAAPQGSEVRYYISAMNDLGAEGTSPRTAPTDLHYFLVDDGFEDAFELQTGWIAGVTGDNASAGVWERANPAGTTYNGSVVQPENDHTTDPGANCYVTGALAGTAAGSYDLDGGRTTLLSPLFDLTGGTDIQISYWRWYTNNLGNNPGQDYWTVQITNDGGLTWTNVEYTLASNAAWQQVVINLADIFPTAGVVQLKFIADDTSPGSLVEALVDDFVLVGTFDTMTPVEDAPQLRLAFDLSQNHPNPFNPRTTVSFSLDRSGPATLNVYDAKGSLVKVLVNENLPAGAHSATWNGDDQTGRPVASGVYFYRLDADGRSLGKRMLLVK